MMLRLGLLLSLLLAGVAQAQQPMTEQQMLASTIGSLFMENARLAVELQKAQAQLRALQEPRDPATPFQRRSQPPSPLTKEELR